MSEENEKFTEAVKKIVSLPKEEVERIKGKRIHLGQYGEFSFEEFHNALSTQLSNAFKKEDFEVEVIDCPAPQMQWRFHKNGETLDVLFLDISDDIKGPIISMRILGETSSKDSEIWARYMPANPDSFTKFLVEKINKKFDKPSL